MASSASSSSVKGTSSKTPSSAASATASALPVELRQLGGLKTGRGILLGFQDEGVVGAPAQSGFQQIGIVGLGCRLLGGIGEGLFRIALRVHHGRFAILNLREGLHGRVLDRLPGRPLDRLLGLGRARRRALQHVPTGARRP